MLFELATDGPGFAVDESAHTLGESLVLPPWLEAAARADPGDPADAGVSAGAAEREDGARLMLVRLATPAGRGAARRRRSRSACRRRRPSRARRRPPLRQPAPHAPHLPDHPGTPMTATAKGPFDVKLTPQGTATDPTAVGRMSLDKTFHGDLEATSVGEMLAVRTAVAGSAGYVAIERVTGTLAGRTGTFALQHWGMMDKGAPDLKISVIPDSGDRRPGRPGRHHDDRHPAGRQALLRVHLHAAAGREMIARADCRLAPARRAAGGRRRADRVRSGRAAAAEAADAGAAGGHHGDARRRGRGAVGGNRRARRSPRRQAARRS